MSKLFLLLLMCFFPLLSFGYTDFQCLNGCTQKGHMYQFCQSQCSYGDSNQSSGAQSYTPPKVQQTDFKCLNECTQKGYMYQFCQERCSY